MKKSETKMPKCKKCGSQNTKPLKTWKMHNSRTDSDTEIILHLCQDCGKKFRTASRIPKKED